jgi:alpha-L-fucosidase
MSHTRRGFIKNTLNAGGAFALHGGASSFAKAGLVIGSPSPSSPTSSQGTERNEVPSYLKDYRNIYHRDPHSAALAWFQNAKFGLFMHYGLYSQLGRGEWVMLRERISLSEYERLKNTFNPDKFDAEQIANCAVDAGVKYVNLTAKHHEGFCLFRSRETDYNSTQALGRRDLVGELAEACEKKGLGLVLYYSYGADWHYPYFCDPSAGWEFYRPAYKEKPSQYRWAKDADSRIYIDYVHKQLRELLTQYGTIAGIWFDPVLGYYARPDLFPLGETYALIRSLQPQCLISFKQGGTGTEDFAAPERGAAGTHTYLSIASERRSLASDLATNAWAHNRTKKIEICDTLQPSAWGYKESDNGKHRGLEEILPLAKNAWGRGANFLLNTGLLPDGSMPPEDVRTYREVGRNSGM